MRLPLFLVLGVVACSGGEPVEPKPEEKTCDLSLGKLDGKTFVLSKKGEGGKDEEDLYARARFYKDGETFKVKYNTRALVDMYDYTCAKEGKELNCKADAIDAYQVCQTLMANKNNCTPGEVAAFTGLTVAKVTPDVERFKADYKKLSEEEVARMKTAFSGPNNQIRGLLKARVDTQACLLTMKDTYQTMTFGEVREMENVVGSARFVESKKDLVFEHCKDQGSVITVADANAAPAAHVPDQKAGTVVNFAYSGSEMLVAKDKCTYTQDVYANFENIQKGTAVAAKDGKLSWRFSHTFPATKEKRGVVHLYRYEDCGSGPQLKGVTCNTIKVE